MKSMIDVRKLLITYGSVIYTGDKLTDLEWIESELYELFKAQMIDTKTLQQAIQLVQNEKHHLNKK